MRKHFYLVLSLISLTALAANTSPNKEMVIIGDSLSCGPFGKRLVQNLEKDGKIVTLFCTVSSAPYHWIHGTNPKGQKCYTRTTPEKILRLCGNDGNIPKFDSIISAHKNANFILALGTNSLFSKKTSADYPLMASSAKQFGNKCQWIGPPHMDLSKVEQFPKNNIVKLEQNLNPFYASLESSISSLCPLIDSRPATEQGKPGNQTVDGIHRNEVAGRYWADHIMLAPSEAKKAEKKIRKVTPTESEELDKSNSAE